MIIPLLAYIFLALFGLYVALSVKENLLWIKQHKLKVWGLHCLFLAMTSLRYTWAVFSSVRLFIFNIDQANNDTNIGSAMNLFPVPLLILV